MNSSPNAKFVVATPSRSVCDHNARALENHDRLRFLALGTRRGTRGVSPERTRLLPLIGLITTLAARIQSPFNAESTRFRLHPLLDHWVKEQLTPGDHIISSYGYVNESFKWVRKNGGKTFLDGGNSHPANFWEIISEEHERWGCPLPPISQYHYRRALAMMEEVDYVLSPSQFVTQSFLARGFRPEQILKNVYPLDLTCFSPSPSPRPPDRPLTLISTGAITLRKGSPYLLEAYRIILKKNPKARLLLMDIVTDSMRPVLEKYRDLPIEWGPALPHPQLVERLREADVFILPSLEEGLARSLTEALATGLPVVTTAHSGVNDFVIPEVNGTVVPIRDAHAIAEAALHWGERVMRPDWERKSLIRKEDFSFDAFQETFITQLKHRQII